MSSRWATFWLILNFMAFGFNMATGEYGWALLNVVAIAFMAISQDDRKE